MNTVILLSAIFVFAYSAPSTPHNHLILENLMKDLNVSLPRDLQNKLVPGVSKNDCHHEDFCKAEHALLKVKHSFMKNWNIVRTLKVYNQKRNCTVHHTGEELQLRELLRNLLLCAQKLYSTLSTA